MRTVRVFVSYARTDAQWFQKESKFNLMPYLMEGMRKQDVVFWYDRGGLVPSDDFRRRIEEEIDQADVSILIVSQGFLSSMFIEDVELPRIMERAAKNELLVFPILVEPCDWEEHAFLSLSPDAAREANTAHRLHASEREWVHARFEVLDGLKKVIRRLRESPTWLGGSSRASSPPPAQVSGRRPRLLRPQK